jgi:hypothetical protein
LTIKPTGFVRVHLFAVVLLQSVSHTA